ncbi:lantibiotic dehydratase [Mucilaginibacter pineti]|nr:lantibiotic dehydratase [Mucilaginibacter pineti]
MKLNIHPQVLYRIPRFPLNATLADSWEELKAAIALSSPEFYGLIKDTAKDDLDRLPPATLFSIWKYFNRAKYRPTPFASFAGVGLCEVKPGNQPSNLLISDEQILHTYVDWPHKEDVKISAAIIAEQNLKLFANSSYYVIKDVIRYISFIDGQFQLSEIGYYETVIAILQTCAQPVSFTQLIQSLNEKGHPLDDPIEFLDQLIELQLLITELHPNIIGQDYFQRIKHPVARYNDACILAERKLVSGALNENLFKDLQKLIPILQQLIPVPENISLQQFASKFSQRFGTEEIPLLQALDPETGIGYDDLAQAGEGEELVTKFAGKRAKANKSKNERSYDQLKKALLAQVTQQIPGTIPILRLEQIQQETPEITEALPLPNTFSLLCSIVDDLICIDSIGNVTANSMLGRFTHTGAAVTQTCRNLAELEQAANPDVLFFDIAYIAEKKIDNVSRRNKIYPLQLSILNYDTSATPLTLDDLTISVLGSNLYLWSKQYNKRLIPRLSSAYNHTRSDLALFRLLCDLQSQGVQAGLTAAGLQNLLPDGAYYPRMQYRNLILAPAKWKVNAKDIGTNTIGAYLQQIGASRYFKAGLADQTLCFDLRSEADMYAFSQYLKKHKNIYIEEAFIPENSLIRDAKDQPYYAQLLMSLTHSEAIYKSGSHPLPESPDPKVQQITPPGQDWLYWEIYCHPQRSDELLANQISQFLQQYRNHIHKWFFIRYSENGEHIRFRVQMKHIKDGYYLISALTGLLQDDIQSGTISELLLKTYKRETERYGWATMTEIENHFNTDSAYILSLITNQLSPNGKYALVINLALAVKEAELFDEKEFLYIVNKFSNSFNAEHHIETSDFKELNNAYKQYKVHSPVELTSEQHHHYQTFKKSFIYNLGQIKTIKRRSLFGSLIHMHVNRLFSSNQRVHEMMIYYFLLKELHRAKATATAVVME